MKLPSIEQVSRGAAATFRRFPAVMVTAILGTLSALILTDYEGPPGPSVLFNVLFGAVLGIPLLLSLALIAERRKWRMPLSALAQAAGILVVAAYGASVPSDMVAAPNFHILRLLMLAAALHFFVASGPFLGSGGLNGFWQYNKTLFIRVFTALLYTGVLYAGLSIALAALDHLFGMNIPGKRYGELWIFLNGIFTTWFFLAGVPEDLDGLETATDYPKGIKIFAQYILFPLVMVYVVILYAYLAKILVSWDWPQGWVSKLILGFSTTGILSLLLLYPVRDRAENVWIRTASRWFYVVMVPLVIMLLAAVSRRMSEYGITEGRYIAVALGLWLGLMSAYFILSKAKSIKVIPGSLCVFTLAISFGPWSPFAVSEKSQVARLERLLENDSILTRGTVHPAARPVASEEAMQISSILAYLHEIHGYDGIRGWFSRSLRADSAGGSMTEKDPALVAKLMGIEYVNVWQAGGNMVILSADDQAVLDVGGYDRLIRTPFLRAGDRTRDFPGEEVAYRLSSAMDTMTFIAVRAGTAADSVAVCLRPLVDRLLKEYGNASARNIPPERLIVSASGPSMKVKVCLQQVNVRRDAHRVSFMGYQAIVLCGSVRE